MPLRHCFFLVQIHVFFDAFLDTKNMKKIIVLCFLIPFFAVAQRISLPILPQGASSLGLDNNTPLSEYMNSGWTTEQGLPQNSVIALCQTHDGYIWIGTQEGLARFDGAHFTILETSNTPALKSNYITGLLEDREGTLWIGTNGGGVCRFKDGVWTTYTTKEGLSNNIVRSLLEDREGGLWIGTNGGGVSRFKNGVFTTYTVQNGLSNGVVYAMTEDSSGGIWFGTLGGGVCRFSNGVFTTYTEQHGLSNNIIRSLMCDSKGAVWIGTNGGGVCRFQNGVFTTYTEEHGLANNRVYALLQDRNGTIWIGTYGGGLNRFRDGKFDVYSTEHGLLNNNIRSLMEDKDGSLWIGTNSGGMNRLKSALFTPYWSLNGLSYDRASCLLEDKDGGMWIGTGKGLNYLKNRVFENYPGKEKLADASISSLLQDRDGVLWIGSNDGLIKMVNGKLQTYTTADGLAHNSVKSILQDRDGALWIGTNGGGLNRLKDGQWTTLTQKDGLTHDAIYALMQDRDGVLWAGTGGGGLNCFKDGAWTSYTTKNSSLSHDVIYSIIQDREGIIWIGTNGGGVNRFKNGTITAITTKEGLFNDVAYYITEDINGFFWLSCNKGVYRVRRTELDSCANGKLKSVSYRAFGMAEGMILAECNGGSQSAGWNASDGRLWFPTMKGVVAVYPKKVSSNLIPPTVIVESMFVNSNDVFTTSSLRTLAEKGDEFNLSAETDKLEFHYTAPWFIAPERVKFKYILEGYDKDWTDAGKRRAAYYNNLPRGRSYRFRVLACNHDGIWNETGASVAFYLAPYFWETSWFFALCALTVISSGISVYRIRMRSLRTRAELLERTVAERTQDLQNANEEIQRQMEIQTEQAREIEMANTMLQEKNLEIEQDREIIRRERERSEALLLNVLPLPIAERLKSGERAIAERFDSVTVLFADIVGFTNLSANTAPEELVRGLNDIFEWFDDLAHKYNLEKIKTIGDAYMVAGGLPERSDDHCRRVAMFALEIQALMHKEAFYANTGEMIRLRIGMHTGEAVAGVIGTSKFAYDLWGDTVNTASRMESHGEAGKIHVSEECFNLLKHRFTFEERGEIDVKGKGTMRTWFLTGFAHHDLYSPLT